MVETCHSQIDACSSSGKNGASTRTSRRWRRSPRSQATLSQPATIQIEHAGSACEQQGGLSAKNSKVRMRRWRLRGRESAFARARMKSHRLRRCKKESMVPRAFAEMWSERCGDVEPR
eukprot:6206740-Pleurochrysis_carterae.AAC.1